MVGNLAEWVDYRVVGADVSRYTSTTRIGKLVRNGIDNITMQWPDLNPLSVTLAMVEGSYFDSKPKNHEGTAPLGFFNTTSTGNGIGFRCVGFRADSMPSVSDLALVDQPKYTASDSTEAVSTRRFPEIILLAMINQNVFPFR
ncbi:MAG: hypothetical protein EOP04_10860 [Proteobacteria bacterium]|nr:MAG: hypothetical protein EOP04_10860 [Pseudomonadota bacterium]